MTFRPPTPYVAVSIREALDVAKAVSGVEAALYAVKYTEAVAHLVAPRIAVRIAAAHVLDHRMELGDLQGELDARRASKERA